jgi:hypothetical protein
VRRGALQQPSAPATSWTSPAAACWLQRWRLCPASEQMPRPLCPRFSTRGAGATPCWCLFYAPRLLFQAACADMLQQQMGVTVLGLGGPAHVVKLCCRCMLQNFRHAAVEPAAAAEAAEQQLLSFEAAADDALLAAQITSLHQL